MNVLVPYDRFLERQALRRQTPPEPDRQDPQPIIDVDVVPAAAEKMAVGAVLPAPAHERD